MKRNILGAALLASLALEQFVPLRANDKSEDVPALKAKKTELENDITALKAQDQSDASVAEQLQTKETELETVDAKLSAAELRAKNADLESAVLNQRTKDAKEAVKLAIKRGAIAAKDDALQAKWEKRCIEDPENIELLASMKGSPALESPRRIVMSGVQITREDSVTVLRAYNAERDPRKKAALFAREIAKRISDCEDLPIHAANTMGTLVGEIVAQQALELLTLEETMLNLFSTDFSGEGAKINQKITSRIVSIPTASDYHVDNGYVSQASVFTDVDVTLTAHRFVQAEFNAAEIAGTSRRLFDEVAPAMADGIGADAISIALAVITAANFANKTTEALVDFDRQTVVEFGGALRDVGVRRNRYLLLSGAYYDKLFSDQTIALLAANQKQELISGDEMMPLAGFAIHRSPTLPAAENLVGFGGGKSAILIAGRVPSDYANALPGVTGGGTSQIITNPKSGLSVHLVQFVDHQKGKAYSRMAYILGANEGQKPAGRRIVSG